MNSFFIRFILILVLPALISCGSTPTTRDDKIHHAGTLHAGIGHNNPAPDHVIATHAEHFNDESRDELHGHMYD